jgi:hypothetical protein
VFRRRGLGAEAFQTRPRSFEQSPRYGPPKFCMRDLPHQDVGECRTLTEFTEGGRGMYRIVTSRSFTGYIYSSVVDADPLWAAVACVECKFVVCGPAARKPLERFE